jgi:hypothetical protein
MIIDEPLWNENLNHTLNYKSIGILEKKYNEEAVGHAFEEFYE